MKSRTTQPASASFGPVQGPSTQAYQTTSLFNPKYSFETQSSVPPPTDSGNAISNPSTAQSISSIPYSDRKSSLSQLPDPLSLYGQSLPSLKVDNVVQTSRTSSSTQNAQPQGFGGNSLPSGLQSTSNIPHVAVPDVPSGNSSDLPPPSIIETNSVRRPQPAQTTSSTSTGEASTASTAPTTQKTRPASTSSSFSVKQRSLSSGTPPDAPILPPEPSYASRGQNTLSSLGDSVPESVSTVRTYGPSFGPSDRSSSYGQVPVSTSLGSIQFPHSSTSLSTYSHGNALSGDNLPTSRLPTSSGQADQQILAYSAPGSVPGLPPDLAPPRPIPTNSTSTSLSDLTRMMLDRVREEQARRLIDEQIKQTAQLNAQNLQIIQNNINAINHRNIIDAQLGTIDSGVSQADLLPVRVDTRARQ